MIRIEIFQEDLAIINRERFYHPQPHIMVRMHILALHAKGENATRIAELTGIKRSPTQIREFLKKKPKDFTGGV